jgi:pseudomonalisin
MYSTPANLRPSPRDRVIAPVGDAVRVSLTDHNLSQAVPDFPVGAADSAQRLDRILLVLKPDEMQQHTLDALLAEQQDPSSPLYRHWLTPQGYATHFGASANDIEQIQQWLERYGLVVDEVAASRRTISFGGTAAQVQAAFRIRLRSYRFAGQLRIASDGEPTVPAAFADVIGGIASLRNGFSEPQHRKTQVSPQFTAAGSHYLSPADFAAIYDVNPLYREALNGNGQTIAIVGRSDMSMADVRAFRSQFGLPAKDPVVVVNGSAPGSTVPGDVEEATLDVEWSGAVANGATIDFVTSASTAASDGVFLSAQYIVDHNLAPIMSVSYGLCENSLGAGGNAFLNQLWEQAASQGITVLVSAGDSGAAGCDPPESTEATHGRAVNGLCSTPYSTCVGGTRFDDTPTPESFWTSTNNSDGASALGYIPESVWNESGSDGLWSGAGGASAVYPKPAWQSAPGMPSDGKRDVPDVALNAASHDGYLVQIDGLLSVISGTSAAAPTFAGLMALVAQKTAERLGNANPQLYKLASTRPSAEKLSVFHDVVSGNNSVPGVTGYSAAPGYDLATGLGSVDAESLAATWNDASPSIAGNPIRVHGNPVRRFKR